MARKQIPVRTITRAGLVPGSPPGDFTPGDHANGMYFVNTDGLAFVEVLNSDGVALNVGFAFKPELSSIDTVAVPDRSVSVAAGSTSYIGPFPPLYDQHDGSVNVDPDAGTLYFRAWVLTSG